MQTAKDLFRQVAKEKGYKVGTIDTPYSDAIYITDGNKQFICGKKADYGSYPLNPKFAEFLVSNKAVCKRVLKKFGFRIIKGKQFYISSLNTQKIRQADRASAAAAYAEKIGYPVFVKPNSGSLGKNAKIVTHKSALQQHIKTMREDLVPSFLVEKFTNRPEYRIFAVEGKVQYMYRKKRMTVTGTGEHTVHELISLLGVHIDVTALKNLLHMQGHKSSSILAHNQELVVQETANISTGAEIIEYRDKIPKAIHDWAKELYKVTGLGVFGVDVFTKGEWDDPANYLIIEVNSNPFLKGIYDLGKKEKAKEICGLILDKYFNKKPIYRNGPQSLEQV